MRNKFQWIKRTIWLYNCSKGRKAILSNQIRYGTLLLVFSSFPAFRFFCTLLFITSLNAARRYTQKKPKSTVRENITIDLYLWIDFLPVCLFFFYWWILHFITPSFSHLLITVIHLSVSLITIESEKTYIYIHIHFI